MARISKSVSKRLNAIAKKNKILPSSLKQVYRRGLGAAVSSCTRKGMTPSSWAIARVNSFVTKSSGTWGKADKDLAARVRGSK